MRGNCKSLSAHSARCPYSETQARVKLGNRGDRVRLKLEYGPIIFGGTGNDRLVGGSSEDDLRGNGEHVHPSGSERVSLVCRLLDPALADQRRHRRIEQPVIQA